MGPSGQQGLIGAPGVQGTTGLQGATGDPGSPGEPGNAGPQGAVGPPGQDGAQGLPVSYYLIIYTMHFCIFTVLSSHFSSYQSFKQNVDIIVVAIIMESHICS